MAELLYLLGIVLHDLFDNKFVLPCILGVKALYLRQKEERTDILPIGFMDTTSLRVSRHATGTE